jgi:hypothetical protein
MTEHNSELTISFSLLSPGQKPGLSRFRDRFNKFLQENTRKMHLFAPTFLLFALNLLDALLTIIWVRAGVATEGNQLMASLLDIGNGPFLGVKIAIGAFAAIVLCRWGNRPLARYGLVIALAVYIGLMGIHFFTGLSAFGYVSNSELRELMEMSNHLLALIT